MKLYLNDPYFYTLYINDIEFFNYQILPNYKDVKNDTSKQNAFYETYKIWKNENHNLLFFDFNTDDIDVITMQNLTLLGFYLATANFTKITEMLLKAKNDELNLTLSNFELQQRLMWIEQQSQDYGHKWDDALNKSLDYMHNLIYQYLQKNYLANNWNINLIEHHPLFKDKSLNAISLLNCDIKDFSFSISNYQEAAKILDNEWLKKTENNITTINFQEQHLIKMWIEYFQHKKVGINNE